MLELRFPSLHTRSDRSEAAIELVGKARKLAALSNRRAVEFLINALDIVPSQIQTEAYFKEAFHYICAQIFAHADLPREAAEAIEASHVRPFSGGPLLYHDAVAQCLALSEAQEEAMARGVPAVMLASMPRAASAALSHTLAKVTRAPLLRISIGDFPNSWLVPVWVQRFLRGGGVLHDHFGASNFNIEVLHRYEVRRVTVLIRDPRAAAASYAQFALGAMASKDDFESVYERFYIPWLRDWLDAERTGAVEVRWIRSADVTSGPETLQAVLAALLEGADSRLGLPIDSADLADVNFVTGDPDAWREIASRDLQAKMWQLLPGEIAERLELRR
jgi:hypothetical protein